MGEDAEMNPIDLGCKLSWRLNVIYCSQHRTFGGNLRACLVALAYVSGTTIKDIQSDSKLVIERYRSS